MNNELECIGKKIRILNMNGFENDYKNLEDYINKTGTINYDYKIGRRFVIDFDDEIIQTIDKSNGGLLFDFENLEFLSNDYKYTKPPLGVMPKDIFEYQRIKDLSRALYEYIEINSKDYELLSIWSEELTERLNNFKYLS